MIPVEALPEGPPCDCSDCRSCCRRPCWPTPAEAQAIVDAGLGGRLMLDHWVGNFTGRTASEERGGYELDTHILCGANLGFERDEAPWNAIQGCVFHRADGLCELHDRGLKPIEGRLVYGCREAHPDRYIHEDVARLWDTAEGRRVVQAWQNGGTT